MFFAVVMKTNVVLYHFHYIAGAMQPSKRGNFFHIESVQPMTEGMDSRYKSIIHKLDMATSINEISLFAKTLEFLF